MAGDWIAIQKELPTSIEVFQIAKGFSKLDRFGVCGRLLQVWSWFDTNTTDGMARSVTCEDIDTMVHQKGFAAAMVAAGWLKVLDFESGGLAVPNFDRWMGSSGKKRLRDNRRAAADAVRKKSEKKATERLGDSVTEKSRGQNNKYTTRAQRVTTTLADDLE